MTNGCLSDMKASANLILQSNDSVEGKHAAFEDVPCFLPVVPKTTSCKPDLFQHIEYHITTRMSKGVYLPKSVETLSGE